LLDAAAGGADAAITAIAPIDADIPTATNAIVKRVRIARRADSM
jgi:hypothetical protein